jgi:hypothetical protein
MVTNDSSLIAKHSVASANTRQGYFALSDSVISAALSTATGNQKNGFEILDGAHLDASRSYAVANGGSGYRANASSIVLAGSETLPSELPDDVNTLASHNGAYGFLIEAATYSALNYAWALGHDVSNRAGLHISGGSVCRCTGISVYENDWGMKAMSGAMVSASEASCDGNGQDQYVDESVMPYAQIVGGCLGD